MKAYNNIFEGFKGLYPKLNASGYILEHTVFPYCYLSQLSNTLGWKNSCGSRFEESIYQFTIYAETEAEITDILNELQGQCDWQSFLLKSPKKLTLLEFLNKSTGTTEPQVYYGRLAYNLITERSARTTNNINAVSIKNGINKLWNLATPFVINDLGRESELLDNGPYCRVPNLTSIENWLTSKSRVEQTNLSFEIFSPGLDELLNIVELIENRYDYCKINMPQTHMIFEWESNSIEEIEPQVWKSSINYTLLNEVLINDN